MKVIEGYMDLIIIIAVIIIGMPIITNLLISCNANTMDYLDDKSVIEMSDYVEYTYHNGQLIPEYLVPPSTSYAGVIFLPLVQDVFQTETHDTMLVPGYTWETDVLSLPSESYQDMQFEQWVDYTVVRKNKFKEFWDTFISKEHIVRTSINPGDDISPTFVKWYYVWDDRIDRWILTDEVNLIYEK